MFRGFRIVAIAFGLALLACNSFAQQSAEPTIKGQPDTKTEQTDRDANDSGATAGDKKKVSRFFTVIEGIENAIRDGIAEQNKPPDSVKEQREKDDLDAQEWMAIWAAAMFAATIASVIVTIGGLVLIKRTLDVTVDTVKAANTTNELFLLAHNEEMRPRIFVKPIEIGYVKEGQHPFVKFEIQNQGKTPARFVRMTQKVSLEPLPLATTTIAEHRHEKHVSMPICPDVNPGFPQVSTCVADHPLSRNGVVQALNSSSEMILLTGLICYLGVDTKHSHFTAFGFRARLKAKGNAIERFEIDDCKWETEGHFSQTT